jgi:DNA replicative helicase MCM subunit Mcm2 (Cdc46/Mcm family)
MFRDFHSNIQFSSCFTKPFYTHNPILLAGDIEKFTFLRFKMDDTDFDRLMQIQRMTASRIRQESEVDNKIKILDIITSLTSFKKPKVQIEEVIIEANVQGLAEAEVMATIDELKKDHLVREPEPGYISL